MRKRIALIALLLLGCSHVAPPPTAEEPSTPPPSEPAKVVTPMEPANPLPAPPRCAAPLEGVRPATDAEWVEAERGECWVNWREKGSEYYLSLSWRPSESAPAVTGPAAVTVGRYQGRLGYLPIEKTGAPFWGPHSWALEVTAEHGRVMLICGMQMAKDLAEGRQRQVEVDARCPNLLQQSVLGDLGRPIPLPTQDLWVLKASELFAGHPGTGHHYTLATLTNSLQVSPDGRRALLHVVDKSRSKTTYASWIEILDFESGAQWRLTEQSDWWSTDWLPDGRVVLQGAGQVFLSDSAGGALTALGETGNVIGYAFSGAGVVAWAAGNQEFPGNEFTLRALDLRTSKLTEYPGRYRKLVNPKAGAPLVISPDGERVALVDKTGEQGTLVILDLASGEERRLTLDPSAEVSEWTQQGLWVRYQVGTRWQMGRFNAQGEEVQQLPYFSAHNPSPDGQWVITARFTEPSETQGFWAQPGLVNLQTGEIEWSPITGYYAVDWTPDGQLVLLQEPAY